MVIAAHSLGTIVIHNYLLRHWTNNGPQIPQQLVTYGSPIGLVCWMWRFLDFPLMEFTVDREHATGDEFFCWTPELPPQGPLRPIAWLNVINFLDPIATAFPIQHVNLAMHVADISRTRLWSGTRYGAAILNVAPLSLPTQTIWTIEMVL